MQVFATLLGSAFVYEVVMVLGVHGARIRGTETPVPRSGTSMAGRSHDVCGPATYVLNPSGGLPHGL